jgi:hypothetical protein
MRTKLSSWVYRGFVTVTFLAALKSIQFVYRLFSQGAGQMLADSGDKAIWLSVLWTSLSTSALLLIIAISLVCRSGASAWLAAWLFLSGLVPALIPAIGTGLNSGSILLFVVATVFTLIIAGIFVFLIKSEEIRRP